MRPSVMSWMWKMCMNTNPLNEYANAAKTAAPGCAVNRRARQ
jgi:hypothetical protein